MFDLQNTTYKDFANANTNYKNVNQEKYLDALNVSMGEDSIIFFENDNGKITPLIDEEEIFL